jgi:hypothetical protein
MEAVHDNCSIGQTEQNIMYVKIRPAQYTLKETTDAIPAVLYRSDGESLRPLGPYRLPRLLQIVTRKSASVLRWRRLHVSATASATLIVGRTLAIASDAG